ncbi:MAG: InlB B-repeat-containing protein [Lachnospiraceae bacterium]|nr:InlB B-repeat-containing protein [Lachnospiraceae bacterium]
MELQMAAISDRTRRIWRHVQRPVAALCAFILIFNTIPEHAYAAEQPTEVLTETVTDASTEPAQEPATEAAPEPAAEQAVQEPAPAAEQPVVTPAPAEPAEQTVESPAPSTEETLPETDTNVVTEQSTDPTTGASDDETEEIDQSGTADSEEEEAEIRYPAQTFTGSTYQVIVDVDADEGAFPEGTTMQVAAVSRLKAMEAAQEAIDADPDRDEEVVDAIAVDITFYNAEGEEIQPAVESAVHVRLTARRELAGASQDVAHMENLLDDAQETVTTMLDAHEDKLDISAERTEDNDGNAAAQDVVAEFDAPSFSVYAIIGTDGAQPGDTVRRIYKFWAENESGEWVVWETHIYKNGDTMEAPAIPTKGQLFFIGWFTGTGEQHDDPNYTGTHGELLTGQTITDIDESATEDEVVNYHAHFDTEVLVRFYNAKFHDILDIREGERGDVISLVGPEPQLTSSQNHVGWMVVNSEGVPVTGIDSDTTVSGSFFDADGVFTGNLNNLEETGVVWYKPEADITLGTKKIYLRAIIQESDKIEFYENTDNDADTTVADYTAPVYVPRGEAATAYMPKNPARAGYTFGGWYLDQACTRAFNASSVLHDTYATDIGTDGVLELYAKWEPGTANYDVYIWREVMVNGQETDPKTYELVLTYTNNTYTGTPGQSATWTTAMQTAFQRKSEATSDRDDSEAFDYRYYDLNSDKTAAVTINGDGSSILHVYYDLKEFTMTFSASGRTNSTYSTASISATITNPDTGATTTNDLSFKVKLGQSLEKIWPLTVAPPTSGTYRNYTFYAWRSASGYGSTSSGTTAFATRQFYARKDLLSNYNGVPPTNGTVTFTPIFFNGTAATYTIEYWLQDANDKDQYTRSDQYSQTLQAPSGSTVNQKPIVGYLYNRTETPGNNTYRFYYDLEPREIILHNYNSVITLTDLVMGQSLSSYLNQSGMAGVKASVEEPAHPAGLESYYEFKGWYTNRSYEEQYKFDFDTSVMGAKNIDLYALWEPKQIKVTFDPNPDGKNAGHKGMFTESYLNGISSENTTVSKQEKEDDPGVYTVTITLTAGQKIPENLLPEDPKREKHNFRNWLYPNTSGAKTRVDFHQREFLEDVTLEASWENFDAVDVYYFRTRDEAAAFQPTKETAADNTALTAAGALPIYAGGARTREYRYDAHMALLSETDNNVLPTSYNVQDPDTGQYTVYNFVGWRLLTENSKEMADDSGPYIPADLVEIKDGMDEIHIFGEDEDEVDAILIYADYESGTRDKTSITCYSNYPAPYNTSLDEKTFDITLNMEIDDYTVHNSAGENYRVTSLLSNHEVKTPTQAEVSTADRFSNISGIIGYRISGWNTQPDGSGAAFEPGESVSADKIVTVYYNDGDEQFNRLYAQWEKIPYRYTVRHVAPALSGSDYETLEEYTRTGDWGDTVSAVQHSFTGMTFDWETTKEQAAEASQAWSDVSTVTPATGGNTQILPNGVTSSDQETVYGVVNENNSLVLTLYYTRNTYRVTYVYEGDIPSYPSPTVAQLANANATDTNGVHYYQADVPYGATVRVAADATLDKNQYRSQEADNAYTFSSWTADNVSISSGSFIMPAQDVTLTGTWTAVEGATSFTIVHKGISSSADDPTNLENYTTVISTYDKYGTAKETGTAVPQNFEGYTFNKAATQAGVNAWNTAHPDDTQGSQQQTFKAADNSVSGTIYAAKERHLTLTLYYTVNSNKVLYHYEGTVPAGATDLNNAPSGSTYNHNGTDASGKSYDYGATVPVAPDAAADGYTFSGWSPVTGSSLEISDTGSGKTFTMPDRDVELIGHFTAKTDTRYTVCHLVEVTTGTTVPQTGYITKTVSGGKGYYDGNGVLTYYEKDGTLYLLTTTQSFTGTTADSVTAQPMSLTGTYAGVTVNSGLNSTDLPSSGTIKGDGSLALFLFYDRNDYQVYYYYTNTSVPAGATDLNAGTDGTPGEYNWNGTNANGRSYQFGQTVTVAPQPDTPDGYTFDGWHKAAGSTLVLDDTGADITFTMPARRVEFHGSFTPETDTVYLIKHYGEMLEEPSNLNEQVTATLTINESGQNFDYEYTYKKYEQITVDGVTKNYELIAVIPHVGETDTISSVIKRDFAGFSVDWDATENAPENTTPNGHTGKANTVNKGVNVTGQISGDDKDNPLVMVLAYQRDTHRVIYQYSDEESVPAGTEPATNAALLAAGYGSESVRYGETVTVMGSPTVPDGYTFSGWQSVTVDESGGSFTMPDTDVIFIGSFAANTDTKYTIKHWVEALGTENTSDYKEKKTVGGTDYILYNDSAYTYTRQGITDTAVSAMDKTFEGFTLNETDTETVADDSGNTYSESGGDHTVSGAIAGDGSLALEFFYTRNSYDVTYAYNGHIPSGVNLTPEVGDLDKAPYMGTYKYGQSVAVQPDATADGYVFDGWQSLNAQIVKNAGNNTYNNFTMPASDVLITGSFTPVNQGAEYRVRYYIRTPDNRKQADINGHTVNAESGTYETKTNSTTDGREYDLVYDLEVDSNYFELPDHSAQGHSHEVVYQATAGNRVTVTPPSYPGYELHWGITTASSDNTNSKHASDTIAPITLNDQDHTITATVYADYSTVISFYYTPVEFEVEYEFEGEVPKGAFVGENASAANPTDLSDSVKKFFTGNTVDLADGATGAPKVTAPAGYHFSGWHRLENSTLVINDLQTTPEKPTEGAPTQYTTTGTFTMPARDVELVGYFTPNTDTKYKEEHYKEVLDSVRDAQGLASKNWTPVDGDGTGTAALYQATVGDTTYYRALVQGSTDTYRYYTLADENEKQGTTGAQVNIVSKGSEYAAEGYAMAIDIAAEAFSGQVAGDGSLTLRAFYDLREFRVTYYYTTSNVPEGAPDLNDGEDDVPGIYNWNGTDSNGKAYQAGQTVTVAPVPDTIAGYTFNGWNKRQESTLVISGEGNNRTFTMPVRDVTFSGSFTANTDTKYTIKHYGEMLEAPAENDREVTITFGDISCRRYEEIGAKWYELMDAYQNTGTTDTDATAVAHSFTGFEIDWGATAAAKENTDTNALTDQANTVDKVTGKVTGKIAGDGTLVLALAYGRIRYPVNYVYAGKVPEGTEPANAPQDQAGTEAGGTGSGNYYRYGETVTIQADTRVTAPDGYTFSGWSTRNLPMKDENGSKTFTMPARTATVEGSFTANNNTPYTIIHWVEALDQNVTENGNVQVKTVSVNGTATKFVVDTSQREYYYTRTGTTDTTVSAVDKTFTGFTFAKDITIANVSARRGNANQDTGNPNDAKLTYQETGTGNADLTISGNLAGNGSLELEFFYTRNTYSITYVYDGHVPSVLDDPKEQVLAQMNNGNEIDNVLYAGSELFKYGQSVPVYHDAVLENDSYRFSGWASMNVALRRTAEGAGTYENFTMPAANVTIHGSFSPKEGGADYRVRYYMQIPDGGTNASINGTATANAAGGSYIGTVSAPGGGTYQTTYHLSGTDSDGTTKYFELPDHGSEGHMHEYVYSATAGQTVTVTAPSYDGYVVNETITRASADNVNTAAEGRNEQNDVGANATTISAEVYGDHSTVISFYYTPVEYKVEFEYEGKVPAGATPADQTILEEMDETVARGDTFDLETRAPKVMAPAGYRFSGWHKIEGSSLQIDGSGVSPISLNPNTPTEFTSYGTFTMPARNVELVGYFTAATNTMYTEQHFKEVLDSLAESLKDETGWESVSAETGADLQTATVDGTDYYRAKSSNSPTGDNYQYYTLAATEEKTGTTDATVHLVSKSNVYDDEGYTEASGLSAKAMVTSGAVKGDGTLVLRAFYDLMEYEVEYYYTTAVPTGAMNLPQKKNYQPGETVKVEHIPTAGDSTYPLPAGYTFNGWNKRDGSSLVITTEENGDRFFVMPPREVTLFGGFTANGDTRYAIKHYGEVLDSSVYDKDAKVTFSGESWDQYTKVTLSSGEKVYELLDAYYHTGTTETAASAVPHSFTGYSVNWDAAMIAEENIKTANSVNNSEAGTAGRVRGTIKGDGSLVLAILYDRNPHRVTYRYDDDRKVPEGALPKTTEEFESASGYNRSADYGETVTVANAPATPEGYTFSGWQSTEVNTAGGSFTMPDADVTFIGSFTPETDTKYTIMHWVEALDQSISAAPTGSELKTITIDNKEVRFIIDTSAESEYYYTRTGTTDTTVSAVDKTFEGLTFSADATQQNVRDRKTAAGETGNDRTLAYSASGGDHTVSGKLAGDDSLRLEFFYTRSRYQVTYVYSGHVPADSEGAEQVTPKSRDLADEPYSKEYRYGETVPVSDDATVDDTSIASAYRFSGWSSLNVPISKNAGNTYNTFTMPAHNVTITGSFVPVTGGTEYRVRYYTLIPDGGKIAHIGGGTTVDVTDRRVVDGDGIYKTNATSSTGGSSYDVRYDLVVEGRNFELPDHSAQGHEHEVIYTGTAGDKATITPPSYAGYQLEWDLTKASSDNEVSATEDDSVSYNDTSHSIERTILANQTVISFYYVPVEYDVAYHYEGAVPEGVLPAAGTAPKVKFATGDTVNLGNSENGAPLVTAPAGYHFSGWHRLENSSLVINDLRTTPGEPLQGQPTQYKTTGTFTMPARNVELVGTFTPNTDTKYTEQHYKEVVDSLRDAKLEADGVTWSDVPGVAAFATARVDGTDYFRARSADNEYRYYILADTVSQTGTTGMQANLVSKGSAYAPEGFHSVNDITAQALTGTIAGDGSLILRAFYDRNEWTVGYFYRSEVVPEGTMDPPADKIYQAGETVRVEKTPKVEEGTLPEGYAFGGWYKRVGSELEIETDTEGDYFTMLNRDVTLFGTLTAQPADYTVKHYGESLLTTADESVTETFGGVAYQKYIRVDGKVYELMDAYPKSGTTDASATAQPHAFDGFAVNWTACAKAPENVTGNATRKIANTVNSEIQTVAGTVEGNGKLVLALLYTRQRYRVTYEYDEADILPEGRTPIEELQDTTGFAGATGSETGGSYHAYEETVRIRPDSDVKVPAGYIFDGWRTLSLESQTDGENKTITMPDRDVRIIGSFSAKTDTKYTVQHYITALTAPSNTQQDDEVTLNGVSYPKFKQVGDTWYELCDAYKRTGTTGQTGNAVSITYEGMTINPDVTRDYAETIDSKYQVICSTSGAAGAAGTMGVAAVTVTLQGLIAGDDSLVLPFFYDRNRYTLRYQYEGHVPGGAVDLNAGEQGTPGDYNWNGTNASGKTYDYGQTVTVADNVPDITSDAGETAHKTYTFDGWKTERFSFDPVSRTFTMPAFDVHINGSFTPVPGGTYYYVHHYAEMRPDEVTALAAAHDGWENALDNNGYTALDGITYKKAGNKYYKDMTVPEMHGTAKSVVTATARNFTGYTYNDQLTDQQKQTTVFENQVASKMQSVSEPGTTDDTKLDITWSGTGQNTLTGRVLDETGNGPLVLQFFYDVNRYSVTYSYDGEQPAGAPAIADLQDKTGTDEDGNGNGSNYHAYGETVTVVKDPELSGYTFHGWHSLGTNTDLTVSNDTANFSMPDRAVILQGYFTANADTPYTVWHFDQVTDTVAKAVKDKAENQADYAEYKDTDGAAGEAGTMYYFYGGNVYKLRGDASKTLSGTTNTTVKPQAVTPGGFTSNGAKYGSYDSEKSPKFTVAGDYTPSAGVTISGDGKTQVRFFYTRNSYKVTYAYSSSSVLKEADRKTFPGIPELNPASGEPLYNYNGTDATGISYQVGETVPVADASLARVPGYTFTGWNSVSGSGLSVTGTDPGRHFTMPARNVRLEGSYAADETPYKVQYFREVHVEAPAYQTLKGLDDSDWKDDGDGNYAYTVSGTTYYMLKGKNSQGQDEYKYYTIHHEDSTRTAPTGTEVTADESVSGADFTGMHYDETRSVKTGIVTAAYTYDEDGTTVTGTKGTLVLKLYYDIDVNPLIFRYMGDVPAGANAVLPPQENHEYGETITVNDGSGKGLDKNGVTDSNLPGTQGEKAGETVEQMVPGYDFDGWMTEYDYNLTHGISTKDVANLHVENGQLTMPDRYTYLYGSFTAREDTPYTIEYYRMDENGIYPAGPDETEVHKGPTGQRITVITDPAGTGEEAGDAGQRITVTVDPLKYPGFAFDGDYENNRLTGVIGATRDKDGNIEGTLTLRLYFRREAYKVTYGFAGSKPSDFEPDEWIAKNKDDNEYIHGATVLLKNGPTTSAKGYEGFAGWVVTDKDGNEAQVTDTTEPVLDENGEELKDSDGKTVYHKAFVMPVGGATVTGRFKPKGGVAYEEHHFLQLADSVSKDANLHAVPDEAWQMTPVNSTEGAAAAHEAYTHTSGDTYYRRTTGSETRYYTRKGYERHTDGVVDDKAIAEAKEYAGYTFDEDATAGAHEGIVHHDGSLVLARYYSIKNHTVTYRVTGDIPEGGEAPPAETHAYGETVTLQTMPAVNGYVFSGFKPAGTGITLADDGTFRMPAANVTFTGSWVKSETVTEGPHGKGHIYVEVDEEEGSPKVTVDDFTVKTAQDELYELDSEGGNEEKLVEVEGDDAYLILTVKPLEEAKVPAVDKKLIQDLMSKERYDGLDYIDISLRLRIIKHTSQGDQVEKEEDLYDVADDDMVTFTVEVPEKLRKDKREFKLIRVHEYSTNNHDHFHKSDEGKKAELLVDEWSTSNVLRFKSALFSTYALAYRDAEEETPAATPTTPATVIKPVYIPVPADNTTSTGNTNTTQKDNTAPAGSQSATQGAATQTGTVAQGGRQSGAGNVSVRTQSGEMGGSGRNAQTGDEFDPKLHMLILCAAFSMLLWQIHQLMREGFLPVKIADEAFQKSHGRHRHVHHSRPHPGKKRPDGLLK